MNFVNQLKTWAKNLKKEIVALYYVSKHPKTPWPIKLLILFIVAYAISPIDLIPDFIPILGYLDELILLPVGIYLVIKLIPESIMTECRLQAEQLKIKSQKLKWIMGSLIILIWLLFAALCVYYFTKV